VTLPISRTYEPMEAAPAKSLPVGPQWQYEPKWDGFRCLAFREKKRIDLQSKSGKPLTRYFHELVAALSDLRADKFVLDGEIVIPVDGDLSFDQLLMRIHPSATRVEKLSRETPCVFIVFDLLVNAEGKSLVDLTLKKRRSIRFQISEGQWDRASFSLHPAACRGTEMVSDGDRRGWCSRETAGSPLSQRHARWNGEDQEVADRGLFGRRISLSRERTACWFAAPRTLQQGGRT